MKSKEAFLAETRRDFLQTYGLQDCKIHPSGWSLVGTATTEFLPWEYKPEIFTFEGTPAVVVSNPPGIQRLHMLAMVAFLTGKPSLTVFVSAASFVEMGNLAVCMWRIDLLERSTVLFNQRRSEQAAQAAKAPRSIGVQPWAFFQPNLRKPGVS